MRANLIDVAVTVLGRSPSPQELAAWMDAAENGQTLGELTAQLLDTSEGQARFPSTATNEAYLTNAYQVLFGREPDAEGMAYWQNQLDQGGVTFDTLVAVLVDGARAETGNPNDAAVANARAEAAETYLTAVESDEIAFDVSAAASVVSAVERDAVADPDLEPTLPGDGETPPGNGDDGGNDGGDNDGGGDNGGGNPPPTPAEPTFDVASVTEYTPGTGQFTADLTIPDLDQAVAGDTVTTTIDGAQFLFTLDENGVWQPKAQPSAYTLTVDGTTATVAAEQGFTITAASSDIDARSTEQDLELTEPVEAEEGQQGIGTFNADVTIDDLADAALGDTITATIGGSEVVFTQDDQGAWQPEDGQSTYTLSVDGTTATVSAGQSFTITSAVSDIAARGTEVPLELAEDVVAEGNAGTFTADLTIDDLGSAIESDTVTATIEGGGEVVFTRDDQGNWQPAPDQSTYTLTVNGATATVAASEGFTVIGASSDIAVRSIETAPESDLAATEIQEGSGIFSADLAISDLGQAAAGDTLTATIGDTEVVFTLGEQGDWQPASDQTTYSLTVSDAIATVSAEEDFTITSVSSDIAARSTAQEVELAEDVVASSDAQFWTATFDLANVVDGEDYTYTLSLTEQVDDQQWTGTVDYGNLSEFAAGDRLSVTVDGVAYTSTLGDDSNWSDFVADDESVLEGAALTGSKLTITQDAEFTIDEATVTQAAADDTAANDQITITPVEPTPMAHTFDLSYDVAASDVDSTADVAANLAGQINDDADLQGLFTASVSDEDQLVITSEMAETNYDVEPVGVSATQVQVDDVA